MNHFDDAVHEGDETVTVSGSAGGSAVIPATLTIADDETTPAAALVLTPSSISEDGGVSTVTAALSGASSEAVTLTVSAAPVSPAAAADYELSRATTLTIAAGATESTGAVTITAVDDDLDAPDKAVTVSATAAGGRGVGDPASVTLTITDDDEAPTFSIADADVEEGKTANFVVTRTGATGNAVQVTWTTAEDTDGRHPASASDYVPVTVPQTLRFRAGETRKIASVHTNDDTIDEMYETFLVRLSGPSPGAEIAAEEDEAIGTIMNDDPAPTVSVADAAPVVEGAASRFPVRLSVLSGRIVTVDWATSKESSDTAMPGKDYVAGWGTLTIREGIAAATIEVATIDDTEIEGEEAETFTVTLANPVNVTMGRSAAAGAIEDDDRPAAVERITRVSEAILPRVGSALMRSRIEQVRDCIDHAASERGEGLSGLLDAAGLLAHNADALNRDEISVPEALSGARLAATAPADRERPGFFGGLTFCAGGDWRRLASLDGGAVSWDGNLFGAHLGGNVRLGGSLLAGLDLVHHAGAADWREPADATGAAGDEPAGTWRLSLWAAQPYAAWFTPDGVRVSALAGYGVGELGVVEASRFDESAGVTLKSVAVSGAAPLHAGAGGLSLRLVADAWLADFTVEGNGSLIEGLSVVTRGARVLAHGEWRGGLGGGGSLAPSARIGLHYDEATGGVGLEAGSGLGWADPAHGLSAALSGRLVMVGGGIREWGVSGEARLAPADGLGPSLSVAPSWGDTADGTRALWEQAPSALPAAGTAPEAGAASAPPSLDVQAGWGLSLAGDEGVLTPFVSVSQSGEDTRSVRLGGRLALGAFSLEVAGTRRQSGAAAPDDAVSLQASASW